MGKSKLYTGGGDRGKTSLVGGRRVPKDSPRLESYGTIDELNAFIGLLGAAVEEQRDKAFLLFVQHKLFSVGAYLATEATATQKVMECGVTSGDVAHIEREIDNIDGQLPDMKAFVLPGGTPNAALAHVCRTVCRRAERKICSLAGETTIDERLLTFVNRLSDYFFVLARKESLNNGGSEIIWDAKLAY
ncbi:MAG: cob(I)yrinic acid a,c-diamide adenosyltransferase [Tannerellaceae bacterium]|nr:cob(I)yrinic acid a,c-diamide adenosyltransferase [Tannerellaceae bacterium]